MPSLEKKNKAKKKKSTQIRLASSTSLLICVFPSFFCLFGRRVCFVLKLENISGYLVSVRVFGFLSEALYWFFCLPAG